LVLHPPNGYLLPLAVLMAAMPVGVIAFHYQRAASIKFICATQSLSADEIADKYGVSPGFRDRYRAGGDFCRYYLH